jgi:hypothetical protein
LKILFSSFYKTSHIDEEVNCTEPSLSVCIPWPMACQEFVIESIAKKKNPNSETGVPGEK